MTRETWHEDPFECQRHWHLSPQSLARTPPPLPPSPAPRSRAPSRFERVSQDDAGPEQHARAHDLTVNRRVAWDNVGAVLNSRAEDGTLRMWRCNDDGDWVCVDGLSVDSVQSNFVLSDRDLTTGDTLMGRQTGL